MTTTLSIDKEIRDRAYLKAKADKISLSAVARMLLLDYAEWRITIWTRINSNIQFSDVKVDDETQQKMDNLSILWNKVWK